MGKLSKLFRWSKKLEIKDGDKVLDTVYLRLVGDAEFQEAKIAALKRSKTLRIKLRNPETEEYKSTFSDIESLTKEELAMGVTFGEITDYRDEALLKLPEKDPPTLPDNPSLEQQEEYEELMEKRQTQRAEALAKFIENRSEERRKELGDIEDIEKLREMYVHSVINMKCTDEFTRTFREYQIYRGTFNDSTFNEPSFDSFDEFVQCAPQLKNVLLNAYINLELTGDELKN